MADCARFPLVPGSAGTRSPTPTKMETPAGDPVDPLVLLQLRVARRADRLAAAVAKGTRSLNLSCWIKAEEEVFGCAVALSIPPDQPDGPPSAAA